MAKSEKVERPTKKSEYEIRFSSVQAKRGWIDLKATLRNPLADAWDFLTKTPQLTTPSNYRLRGDLGLVTRDGSVHKRWQHKPTLKGDARIWFYVVDREVYLEQVHTSHPHETK
ncbi:hypothetical protein FQ154_10795 [Paeniglutamicibacter gangotriensis]|uniref:Type II toxin-antitoxin system RelE/ParE family toxin n=1 Tax=Paeniglutamicibacter gangotriensis TaxID=254787 RepID=A0A5B0EBU1_9MICC|nr:hypothetical protein [Paeniglutamicibacter gangotriensis]KAA0976353.1 hypothetical protein FQ154_10795 [Paeniglutamicibacter gangotriensis]